MRADRHGPPRMLKACQYGRWPRGQNLKKERAAPTAQATPKMASANHIQFVAASLDEISTLPALFRWRVENTPRQEAYRQFDNIEKRWTGYSWQAIDRQIEAWRRAIDAEQLEIGERVAILMPNGIEHIS